jgi:transposase-like protein
MPYTTTTPDKPLIPTACPSCRSTDLKTTSKTVDEATYWRCAACGEVWNAGRRREATGSGWGLRR